MYDAIVVGAGPAGSMAATILAKRGRSVLLLDQARFPRDKACGDAIGSNSMSLLSNIGLPLAKIAPHLYCCDRIRATSSKGYVFEEVLPKKEGHAGQRYIIPRRDLDHILFSFALQQGAEFERLRVIEPLIEQGVVCGGRSKTDGRILERRAKIIIAADGANSVIAKCLRTSKAVARHTGVAVRAYFSGVRDLNHCMDFYFFDPSTLGGYGWVFPLGKGMANVGVGARLDVLRKSQLSLRQVFEGFIQDQAVAEKLSGATLSGSLRGQTTPFASQRFQRAFSGALLVGDAGAFVSPLTGAGIYNALVSGQIAAEVALEALEAKDTSLKKLHSFEARWRSVLGDRLRDEALVQRLLHWPGVLDMLIKYSSKNSWLAHFILNRV